jgi:hypothetical protein
MVFILIRRSCEAETAERIAGLSKDRLLRLLVLLEEQNVQGLDQRPVQPVQPDNGIFRFVVMIVPRPIGRKDQISFFHGELFTAHGGVSPMALNHEANRRHVVTVRSRNLTRVNDRKRELQCVRG